MKKPKEVPMSDVDYECEDDCRAIERVAEVRKDSKRMAKAMKMMKSKKGRLKDGMAMMRSNDPGEM